MNAQLQFLGDWSPSFVLVLALLLAGGGFWLYRRETRKSQLGWRAWLLPALRAATIFLIVLTLAEPSWERRYREGQPGKLVVLLDGSRSMSLASDATAVNGSRFERATSRLQGPQGLLSRLQNEFDVSVARSTDDSLVDLWNSEQRRRGEVPATIEGWLPTTWGEQSPLGDALQATARQESLSALSASQRSRLSVVLFSDGLNNSGTSPLTAAQELGRLGVPIFSVGMAPFEEPPDFALRSINTPTRLERSDTLRGKLVIAEPVQAGQPYSIQLLQNSEAVWQAEFESLGSPQREIEFAVPVAALFERASQQLPDGAQYTTVPVKLTAVVRSDMPEVNLENNQHDTYLSIASQKSRVLLIDGRSRWETRYLKNMFDRDPAWELESLIHSSYRPAAGISDRLPQTRDELFAYDLIVFGDIDRQSLPDQWLGWIRDFVETAGGGIVFIDGARQHLRDDNLEILQRMLPVRWRGTATGDARDELTRQAEPTAAGRQLAALQLTSSQVTTAATAEATPSDELAEQRAWSQLPELQFVARTEALPGSEILLEAVSPVERLPLMVSRRYGAGRVLYLASDETWRWRYELADLVHQRLWNQLARWTMKTPMSIHGEFLSLDTGAASYNLQQSIPVRCQLRESDGQPASAREATAILYAGERQVGRVPMTETSVPGSYAARFEPLPAGDYRVQIAAAGFSSQALSLQSQFSVVADANLEMQRVASDEALLQSLATESGGVYLRDTELDKLDALLQPRTAGRIRHSATLLWQTYGWFSAALVLLVTEWIIRKRAGLV